MMVATVPCRFDRSASAVDADSGKKNHGPDHGEASPFLADPPAAIAGAVKGVYPEGGIGMLSSQDIRAPNDGLGSNIAGKTFMWKVATMLQKVYRGYRTRRKLADSAVLAEEFWWRALDYAQLNRSTVSFFNPVRQEASISRWNRIGLNASKVGQGLSYDAKAVKLAFQHWIEAIDPRHRYGHNLHIYYKEWRKSEGGQPFFYWLDVGDGRGLDLNECPRSLLRTQCVKYLGPQERDHYEYVPIDGKILHKETGVPLDTTSGTKGKWIFVMSTSRRLYAGQKMKGMFHHSSFLAGGATLAAGRITAEDGIIKRIWAYSGHYRPTMENFNTFLSFLKENGVHLNDTQTSGPSNEDYSVDSEHPHLEGVIEATELPPTQLALPTAVTGDTSAEPGVESRPAGRDIDGYKRTLSGGLKSPIINVPRDAILQRIDSKRKASSYQLGHQISLKWSNGAGPRIGCVADYPDEVKFQALEFLDLSPRRSTDSKRSAAPYCERHVSESGEILST